MILVLSSQRFPYLFFSRMATFSPSFLGSNEISRLQNVSPYVSLKGPLVRSYDICLHVGRFTQLFSLLLSSFSINCYVRTVVSLPAFLST